MEKIILICLFFLVLVSFLANPAPISLEIDDMIMFALSLFVGITSFVSATRYKLNTIESELITALLFYISYLLISTLMGLLHGIPILNVLRSIGPYLSFIPLLFIGFLPQKKVFIWSIALMLIIVGLLQASYLIYLYFSHSSHITNTLSVLRNRITLIDPRTTLPLLLSASILPIIFNINKNIWFSIFSFFLIFLSLFAGVITLTRAIVLSIVVGWLVFILLYAIYQFYFKSFSILIFLKKFIFYFILISIVLLLVSQLPNVKLMESGLLTRFLDQSANGHAGYTNGRITDEWIPALTTWYNSDWLSFIFGIGAGNSFIVLNGEERTYIHNLSIYSLVYGGIFGLLSCFGFYFTLLKTLIKRILQTKEVLYIAFSALLCSLFFYSQLFAVHKGFAFNVMLFLIVGVALKKPSLIKIETGVD